MRVLCALTLALFSLAARAESLPFFSKNDMTPYWPNEKALNPATVPAFRVLNQESHPVSELAHHVSLVNFFFTSCGSVCPLMMTKLSDLQKTLRGIVRVYSLSVDPEIDRPERLQEYAKKLHLDLSHWTLLTGSRDEIYRLGRETFHADGAQAEQSFIHTTNVYLVDADRRIRGIYDTGKKSDLALLVQDVQRLEKEAR